MSVNAYKGHLLAKTLLLYNLCMFGHSNVPFSPERDNASCAGEMILSVALKELVPRPPHVHHRSLPVCSALFSLSFVRRAGKW